MTDQGNETSPPDADSQVRIESGPGHEIPTSLSIHNPWVINSWRIETFKNAVGSKLPPDISEEEIHSWTRASVDAAHAANNFDPSEGANILPESVQRVSRLLGNEDFIKIYNSPPPPEVIDYMLKYSEEFRRGERKLGLALQEITVEVLRGRLTWEDRFTQAGVPTPDEFIAAHPEQKAA